MSQKLTPAWQEEVKLARAEVQNWSNVVKSSAVMVSSSISEKNQYQETSNPGEKQATTTKAK